MPDSDIRPAPPLHFCSREPFKGGRVATSMKSAQLSWRLPSTHNTLWVNGALQAPSLLPAAGQFRPQLKQDTRRHCNVRAGADRMVGQWLSSSLPGQAVELPSRRGNNQINVQPALNNTRQQYAPFYLWHLTALNNSEQLHQKELIFCCPSSSILIRFST